MNRKEFTKLLLIFLVWKLVVFSFANIGQVLFPLHTDFLGGGLFNYLKHPMFWGFINFDGEHYLSIARDGYLPLTYFYFPLYPILVKTVTLLLGGSFVVYAFSGLLLSNIFLFLAVLAIYLLGKHFFDPERAYLAILLFIFFPTSFFLGAFYNESLFIALVAWSFYLALKKRWTWSFALCGLATATRLVGLALIPALLYEYWVSDKSKLLRLKTFAYLSLSGLGMFLYLIYLKVQTGDFMAFFHNVEIFGAQRSTKIILLPQVFYRYVFKVLPAVNYDYLPVVFTTLLEITTATIFLVALYFVFKKLNKSLFIYAAFAYLIPTLSGSFSSFPRYALGLFPVFLVAGDWLAGKNKSLRYILLPILLLCGLIATSLYIRGYFVS
jgi:hypothetical protein